MQKNFVCPKCGGTEYYQERNGRIRCTPCQKERMRKIYATEAYKQKHREDDRRRRRGCRKEKYSGLMIAQDGKCAICGAPKGEELRIDHCHATGKLRGLLCDNCNWGLGNFKDNPDLLNRAIQYLDHYKT